MKILNVDDNLQDQYLLSIVLKKCDIQAETEFVQTLSEAEDYIKRNTKENDEIIVLLDLNLDPESGFDLFNMVSEFIHNQTLKVFILSTSNYQGDKDKATQLGAAGYIVKPSKIDSYVESLNKALQS